MKKIIGEQGQGMMEMVFLLPLFVILGAGAIMVAYMCWQGIKVQEAANVAARVSGQETVGLAKDLSTLMQDNGLVTGLGVQAAGDPDPSEACTQTDPIKKQDCLGKFLKGPQFGAKLGADPGGTQGVYWGFRKMVYDMFSPGEQKRLFVLAPENRGTVSEVTVKRVMQGPEVFGWKPPIITVEAKAYGGEDTYMYSLPRSGRTGTNGNGGSNLLWKQIFSNKNLADTDAD
jgi:hypothetical protein